jgi:hypothetical protein
MTVKRKLSFIERLVEVNHSLGPVPISIVPVIKGNIPEERVKIALTKLQEKHPALRARIEGKYICYEDTNYPPIELRIVERTSNDTWKSEMEKHIREPWSYREGRMLRVLWVRSEEISEFVITGLHLIIDGKSLFVLTKDFYTFLNQPHKEVKPYRPVMSMEALFPDIKLTWKQKLAGHIWTEIMRLNLFFTTWNKKTTPTLSKELSLQLDEQTSTAFREACKKHNVSPGNASYILLVKLIKKYFCPEETKCHLTMPLDLRRYSPVVKRDMVFAYGTAPLSYQFHIQNNDSLWEQAYNLEQEIIDLAVTKQKAHRNSLKHSYVCRIVFANHFYNRILKLFIKKELTTVPEPLSVRLYNLGLISLPSANAEFKSDQIHVPGRKIPYFSATCHLGMGDNFGTAFQYHLFFNEYRTPEEKMKQLLVEFEEDLKALVRE